MNIQRYENVLNYILKNQTSWDQSDWHSDCGTAHCFAGIAEMLLRAGVSRVKCSVCGGYERVCANCSGDTRTIAENYLELTAGESKYLFHWNRTVRDFWDFLG